jgi:hypothetical protein
VSSLGEAVTCYEHSLRVVAVHRVNLCIHTKDAQDVLGKLVEVKHPFSRKDLVHIRLDNPNNLGLTEEGKGCKTLHV